jgi:hypothetical protein
MVSYLANASFLDMDLEPNSNHCPQKLPFHNFLDEGRVCNTDIYVNARVRVPIFDK